MKTVNPVELMTVLNSTITKRAWLLHEILDLRGIHGIEVTGTGSDTLPYNTTEEEYNTKYFEHSTYSDESGRNYQVLITTKDDHEYTEELEKLSEIDFGIEGKVEYAPEGTPLTEKADKLATLILKMGNIGINHDTYHERYELNGEYFRYDNTFIVPTDKYADKIIID